MAFNQIAFRWQTKYCAHRKVTNKLDSNDSARVTSCFFIMLFPHCKKIHSLHRHSQSATSIQVTHDALCTSLGVSHSTGIFHIYCRTHPSSAIGICLQQVLSWLAEASPAASMVPEPAWQSHTAYQGHPHRPRRKHKAKPQGTVPCATLEEETERQPRWPAIHHGAPT